MNDSLQIVPSTDDVSTGVRDASVLADGLADVLADTFRLTFKTQAYHWNVTGPAFFSIHKLTEEHYEDMFEASDTLAERMRALGQLAPLRMDELISRSRVNDLEAMPSAGEMMDDLARDHELLAHRLHALVELAGDHKDPVTEDLATARSTFHEQAAWMLRAIAAN